MELVAGYVFGYQLSDVLLIAYITFEGVRRQVLFVGLLLLCIVCGCRLYKWFVLLIVTYLQTQTLLFLTYQLVYKIYKNKMQNSR